MRLFAVLSILASLTVQCLAAQAEDIGHSRRGVRAAAYAADTNISETREQARLRVGRRIDDILKVEARNKGEDNTGGGRSGSAR